MIKAVFLDVGGIILKIDWRNPLKALGIEPERRPAIVEKLKDWPVFHRFEKGQATADEFFDGINALLGLKASREQLNQAWISLIVGDLNGSARIFDWLNAQGLPVFALSNTNIVHDEYQFQHFPVLSRFDRFFKSYLMGERKPGVEIYRLAAQQTGFSPEQIIFIDDTLENVEGARRAGWRAFQTVDDTTATLEILRREIRSSAKP